MSRDAGDPLDLQNPLSGNLLPLVNRLPGDAELPSKAGQTAETFSGLNQHGVRGSVVHESDGKRNLPRKSSNTWHDLVSKTCHTAPMSLGNKIKLARKDKKISQERLGKMLQPPVKKQAVTGWESNRFQPSAKYIPQLVQILGRSYEWLTSNNAVLNGDGPMVPLVGYVGAGGKTHFYNDGQGPYEDVEAPGGATAETVAVEVRGDSMHPIADRWLLYYDNREDPPTEDLLGKLCIVGLADDRVLVKKLVRGSEPGLFHLISTNSDPLTNQKVEWAAQIKWINPRPRR